MGAVLCESENLGSNLMLHILEDMVSRHNIDHTSRLTTSDNIPIKFTGCGINNGGATVALDCNSIELHAIDLLECVAAGQASIHWCVDEPSVHLAAGWSSCDDFHTADGFGRLTYLKFVLILAIVDLSSDGLLNIMVGNGYQNPVFVRRVFRDVAQNHQIICVHCGLCGMCGMRGQLCGMRR